MKSFKYLLIILYQIIQRKQHILNMGCDYYIQNELVIEYHDKSGRINTIYTNRSVEKGYVFNYQYQHSYE